jgi:hypothetical protein
MSSPWSDEKASSLGGYTNEDYDDAEKGLHVNTDGLPVMPPPAYMDEKGPIYIETLLSPMSPIHEGITPFSSVPVLQLSWPAGYRPSETKVLEPAPKKPAPPKKKKKASRLILFRLWFNTYRKFFTLVTVLNLVGIVMAALGRFRYADNHLGALVLGNLLCAIMMRNELFMRFLYMVAIYGLRSVRPFLTCSTTSANRDPSSGLRFTLSWQQLPFCNTLAEYIPDARSQVLGKADVLLCSQQD